MSDLFNSFHVSYEQICILLEELDSGNDSEVSFLNENNC